MKLRLSTVALLLQGLSYTQAVCPETFTTSSCSLTAIETAVGSECDLETALGFSSDELDAFVESLCDGIMEDKTLSWTDITTEGGNPLNYQWDDNYFDGGTSWNDYKETPTEPLHSGDAGDIQRQWTYHASNKIISWPTSDPNTYGTNFENCDARAVTCCFTSARLAETPLPVNADVCHHDLANSADSSRIHRGFAVFHDFDDKAYCTGFSWSDDEGSVGARYKGNALFYASMYHNLYENGFVENIPSSPLCACVEQMATVTEADCVEVTAEEEYTFTFGGDDGLEGELATDVSYGVCAAGNLVAHYATTATSDEVRKFAKTHIVDNCTTANIEFSNDNFYVPGQRPPIADESEWTLIVGKGHMYFPPVGETAFREAVEASPNKIIRRVCPYCAATHRDIYYKRLTDIPPPSEQDFLGVFMDNWFSTPSNVLGVDFNLYSSYEDALAGTGAWIACNYDAHLVGFPRDCGPYGLVGSNWNSYEKTLMQTETHAFMVEKERVTTTD